MKGWLGGLRIAPRGQGHSLGGREGTPCIFMGNARYIYLSLRNFFVTLFVFSMRGVLKYS